MKTITKKLNLLEASDIEKALSEHFERPVSLSEVECSLVHCVPCDTYTAEGQYLELTVGDDDTDSFDLFWDEELNGHYLDGKQLSLDCKWADADEVFAFDTSKFKSFESYTDGSD